MIAAIALLASLLEFGPERALVARAEPVLAPGPRDTARVATQDLGSLVVWNDFRAASQTVRAARLDRNGAVLDPYGLLIASDANVGDVVWTGSGYLVSYSVKELVYVRVVSPDAILGDPIAVLSTEWMRVPIVRMASDGTTALLLTSTGRGAVLAPDGAVRRTFAVAPFPAYPIPIDVAAGRDAYGVVYTAAGGIVFRRIRAEDEDPQQILSDTYATSVAIGSDGNDFLVVFRAFFAEQRLQTLHVGDPFPLPKIVTDVAASEPDIMRRGGDYLVTFLRDDDRAAGEVRLSESGLPLGATRILDSSWPVELDVRSDGVGIAASVRDHKRVEVAFFDNADAALSDARPISFSAPAQGAVFVATQGSAIVLMYGQGTADVHEMRLQRGIGGPSVVVGDGSTLDVAIDGDVVWAAWSTNDGDVYVRRYTTSLVPIDAAPLHVYTRRHVDFFFDFNLPRIAAGGGTLLVVEEEPPLGPAGIHAHVVREVNGQLTVDAHFLATTYSSSRPTAVWNGREFVIAWARSRSEGTPRVAPPQELVVQRLGIDAEPVVVTSESSIAINAIEAVRVNDEVVLVWQTSPQATSFLRTTWAARLGSSEHHLIENPDRRSLRAITALGEQILLLWSKNDVESVLLSAELAEIERGTVPVPASGFDLAALGASPVLAYSRIAPEHGDVFRAFVRTPLTRRRAVR